MNDNAQRLAEVTQRINELRQIPQSGGKLTKEQLKEGVALLAEAQVLRASRVSKAKGADLASDNKKSIADLGF